MQQQQQKINAIPPKKIKCILCKVLSERILRDVL